MCTIQAAFAGCGLPALCGWTACHNPVLTGHEHVGVTEYFCVVQMLTLHSGQPFDNVSKPPSQESLSTSTTGLQSSPVAAAALAAAAAAGKLEGRVLQRDASLGKTASVGSSQHWRHNKFPGSFFNPHLKQAY